MRVSFSKGREITIGKINPDQNRGKLQLPAHLPLLNSHKTSQNFPISLMSSRRA